MSRAPRILRILAAMALGALLGAGVYAVDRRLSLADRVAYLVRIDELQFVRDALLRYELERGALPPSLEALVPRFLRPNQVEEDGRPLYRYEPQTRRIAMLEGQQIRGLVRRRWPPRGFVLPPPPTRPVAVSPPPSWRPPVASLPSSSPPLSSAPSPEVPPPPSAPASASGDRRLPVSNDVVTIAGVAYAPPPPGAWVMEAEYFSEMNWAWEAHPDPLAGGGVCMVCKEGTTAGSSQSNCQTFNFYDPEERPERQEQSVLKIHFRLPQSGRYYILGRVWATCSHCSNSLNVGLDRGGLVPGLEKIYYGEMMGSSVPFRWVWASCHYGPFYIPAGDHYLHVFPHEDGVFLDQLMLSPRPYPDSRYRDMPFQANLLPVRGTAWEKRDGPMVHLHFDVTSRVFTAGMPAEVRLAVRRLRPATGTGTVSVVLREAGTNGADVALGAFRLDLADLPELQLIPVDFAALDMASLARREYLLTAEFQAEGKPPASGRVALMHPFAWEASRDFDYLPNEKPGPLDPGQPLPAGAAPGWKPLADSIWTPLGQLDFGLHTVGNSLHAPERRTIYARTRVAASRTAVYLLKLQSDDQMRLWIDGQDVCRIDTGRPVTRNQLRWKVRLEKGEHELLMRVNNDRMTAKLEGGPWQASLRIRTADDRLSDVVGLPLPAGEGK